VFAYMRLGYFADTERRRGAYEAVQLPWVPGTEGAGIIDAIGEGVNGLFTGQRVAVLAHPSESTGTYAEFVVCPANRLILLPDDISLEIGAAFPMQGLTAFNMLKHIGQVKAGNTVLVHGASGGFGQLAVQLVKAFGATPIAVVSGEEKKQAISDLNVPVLVNTELLHEGVFDLTKGKGVDIVLDSIGLATQKISKRCLAPFGTLIHCGAASGDPLPVDIDSLYEKSLRVAAYWIWTPMPEGWGASANKLMDFISDGQVRIQISRSYSLEEAYKAHVALEERSTTGKLLLNPTI
jgi:NADPH:quinone reductase